MTWQKSPWCWLAAVLPLTAPVAVTGQTSSEIVEMRRGIDVQRNEAERSFNANQAACYQQFAVNDCLIQAKKRRSATLAELKRQEVVLNDEERKRRAAMQVSRQDERFSLEAEQRAAEQRATRAESARVAEQRQRDRALTTGHLTGKDSSEPREREHHPRVKAQNPKSAVSPAEKAQQAALAQENFARKQQDAAARKVELDKRRRERAQAPSSPLPPTGAPATPLTNQLAAPTSNAVKP